MPEVQGRTIDGIWKARISNNGPRQTVNLKVIVTEAATGAVLTIQTPAFELLPGVNNVPSGAAYQASIVFGNSKLATIISQSGFFPSGDYDYCFQLYEGASHNGPSAGEQCFNYNLEPFSSLQLIQPYDGDKICDKRPSFSWQPLIPMISGVQYRLLLVEVKGEQQPVEAIRTNLAIINQRNIPMPLQLFPSIVSDLVVGGKYAWQVAAYRDELMLAESEIWTFNIDCEKDSVSLPKEAFRNIEDLAKGNFYIARGQLLFAFNNTYEATTLQYSIRCLSKPEQKITKLPKIKVTRGRNQVVIDLSDNKSFTDSYFYIMDVKLPDGEEKQLRFIYKNAE
jgi:hypothetical protein